MPIFALDLRRRDADDTCCNSGPRISSTERELVASSAQIVHVRLDNNGSTYY